MAPSSRRARVDGRAHARTIRGTAVPGARPHRPPIADTLWTMSPRRTALGAAILIAVLTGCSGSGTATSFDPTSPCTTDGLMAGAYPALEAMIPTDYEGRGPDHLDSGRHCTPANLGSLAKAGISEVRFAGGTWDFGGYRAAALVVFQGSGLTADLIAEFYASSARSADRTTVTGESTPTLAGRPTHRLDTMTGDRTQTVVTWAGSGSDTVDVVITNDLPDPKIEAAVAAFGTP